MPTELPGGLEATPADPTQQNSQAQQGQSAPAPQQTQQSAAQAGQNANAGSANAQQQEVDYVFNFPREEGVDVSYYESSTKALAKELGLSKEAAQKIVDRDVQMRAEGEKRIAAIVEEQKTKWAEQTRADKEVGGQNLESALGSARSVLDRFGTPEFKKEISESGYGNNVELIRLLSRIGKAMKEDGFVQAQAQPRDSRRIADLMYPSMSAQQES